MREQRRTRRHIAWSFLAVIALLGAVMTAWLAAPAGAAAGFASPAFQSQWQAGEAITPNFWGPLSLAHDGQQEPYVEGTFINATGGSQSGQRLVQYFDKARMELTNPASGTVTNGLLATELITGKLQLGDNSFQQLQPAGVPVAGDPDNIGPTYASINANAATLLANTPAAAGSPTTRMLSGAGTLGTYTGTYASDPQGVIAAYDTDTQHNVPAAFANYRTKAGLLTIGFAIAEPFWSNVKVAGVQRDVLVQAFQRRVLTYTPTNNDPFKVEMGNIGQHYYTWRYQSPQTQVTPTTTGTTTPTVVGDTTPPKITGAPVIAYATPYSFAVTWPTNKPASSEIKYGTSSNYANLNNKQKSIYTLDHFVIASGLTPGQTYHWRVQSTDPSGNQVVDDQDRTVTLPAMNAIPALTNILVSKQTTTTFSITWTTNALSTSRIEYGTQLGVYDQFRKGDNNDPVTLTHTATAISLEPNKIYYFRVVSLLPPAADGSVIAGASDDPNQVAYPNNLVQTKAQVAPLTISDLTAGQDKGGQPTKITFSTDRPASVIIEIGTTNKLGGGLIYGSMTDYPYPFTRNLHNIAIPLPVGTWYYRVTVYDEQGIGTSDVKTYTVS
ncbi:MAG: fibronectin type III domain-containing protein [Thermomicrobiales bacterium]